MRKIVAFLLSILIALGTFASVPCNVNAAEVSLPAQIYVGDDTLFNYNEQMWRTVGSGWSYNTKTNTLYLHGNINKQYAFNAGNQVLCAIRSDGDLNIVVDGPSLINLGNNGLVGISVAGNCNLTLKNKLTIKGGAGIVTDGKLTINGNSSGKLYIRPKGHLYGGITANADLSIKNVNIDINTPTLYAIHTNGGNIKIQNCTMKVTGYTGAIAAFYGNVTISGKRNNITAKASAKNAPAIAVILKSYTSYIGININSGSGRIVLKKTKISSPKNVKTKMKTFTKTYPIVNGSQSKIKVKMATFNKKGICSKIVIK